MGKPARHLWQVPLGAASRKGKVREVYSNSLLCKFLRLLCSSLHRLAAMIARVETSQGWLEQITYNMNHMVCLCQVDQNPTSNTVLPYPFQPYKEQAKHLAGPIALLKMHTTRSAQQTATDAVQLFGGRGTY